MKPVKAVCEPRGSRIARRRVAVASLAITLCLLSGTSFLLKCKVVSADGANSSRVTDFCLSAGDFSGWTPGGCYDFDVQGLYSLIDGGAGAYESKGMLRGIRQSLAGSDARTIVAWVDDFGTAANAMSMFSFKKQGLSVSDTLNCRSFGDTTAIIGVYGITQILSAHIDKYYFELTMDGFADNDQAKTVADNLMQWYQLKN